MGCSPSPESYFPVTEGSNWQYVTSGEAAFAAGWERRRDGFHMRTETQSLDNMKVEIAIQPARYIGKTLVHPRLTSLGGKGKNSYAFDFVSQNDQGVLQIARQARGQDEPTILEKQEYWVRFPLVVGTSWENSDEVDFDEDPTPMAGMSRIVATGETVTVPAGTFKKCVKIQTTRSGKIEGSRGERPVFIDQAATTWLAPEVGMVKHTEKLSFTPESIGSQDYTFELVKFRVR